MCRQRDEVEDLDGVDDELESAAVLDDGFRDRPLKIRVQSEIVGFDIRHAVGRRVVVKVPCDARDGPAFTQLDSPSRVYAKR